MIVSSIEQAHQSNFQDTDPENCFLENEAIESNLSQPDFSLRARNKANIQVSQPHRRLPFSFKDVERAKMQQSVPFIALGPIPQILCLLFLFSLLLYIYFFSLQSSAIWL